MTGEDMKRLPGISATAKGYGAKRSPALRILWLALLAWLGTAGCATFGLPDFPVELRYPPRVVGALFVVYDPDAVMGFGHTGLILHDPACGLYLRYDQYASSEIAYGRRVREGTHRFWQVIEYGGQPDQHPPNHQRRYNRCHACFCTRLCIHCGA